MMRMICPCFCLKRLIQWKLSWMSSKRTYRNLRLCVTRSLLLFQRRLINAFSLVLRAPRSFSWILRVRAQVSTLLLVLCWFHIPILKSLMIELRIWLMFAHLTLIRPLPFVKSEPRPKVLLGFHSHLSLLIHRQITHLVSQYLPT